MTPTITDAAYELRWWRAMARVLAHGDGSCVVCNWRHLRVDAAALAYDLSVARTYAGRHPRIASKEIPG